MGVLVSSHVSAHLDPDLQTVVPADLGSALPLQTCLDSWLNLVVPPSLPHLPHWDTMGLGAGGLVSPCPAGCRAMRGSLLLNLLLSSRTTLGCVSLGFAKLQLESLHLGILHLSLGNQDWCSSALLVKHPSCQMQPLLFVISPGTMVKCFFPLSL